MKNKRNNYIPLLIVFLFSFPVVHSQEARDTSNVKTNRLFSVSGDELVKSFTPNLISTLAGRLPGLTVTQGSDEAGIVDNTLRIRGNGTFAGSQDPLIVIDGFVTQYKDGDGLWRTLLSQLAPEEIESVSLLKDAAATAVYGLRGANGVLLVTTKRGYKSPLKISFCGQIGFQEPSRTPRYPGSYDYAGLYNEAYRNTNHTSANFYSDEQLALYRNATGADRYLYPDVDWYKETLRERASIYKAGLNFRGGNEVVGYFVLLNYLGNAGLIRKTGDMSENAANQNYERYNIRTNTDINITRNFSAHVTLGMAIEDKTTPAGRNLGKNTNDLFYQIDRVPPNAFPVYNPDGSWGGNSAFSNPLANITERGYWTHNARNINAALKLRENLDWLTPGLSASAAISLNSYYLGYTVKSKNYEYFSLSEDPVTGNIVYSDPPYGMNESMSIDDSQSDQWRNITAQGFLDYRRIWGIHDFDAKAFYRYEEEHYGNQQAFCHEGLGMNLVYTLKNRYIAGFSFGMEATETFAEGKRTGFFPAGSLGWIVTEENFLKDNAFLNFLKINASYGLTGNDKIGGSSRFMYEQDYGYREGYYLGTGNINIDGIAQLRLANPDITWEKEKKFNGRIETAWLKKWDFSFEYFSNHREQILCLPNRTVPSHLGAELPYMNIGSAKNSGFETAIRYNGNVNRDFQYFVRLTAWMAKNKILYQSEELKAGNNHHLYSTGHRIGQAFVLEALGFYTQAEIDNPDIAKPAWKEVVPGDIRYKDRNKDGTIDSNDIFPIGYTPLPEISAGFDLGFSYGNFDFSAFAHAALNRTVYLNTGYYRAFQDNGKISAAALNRWTSEETAASATYPRLSLNNEQNNFRESSFWQRNGNFLKLRNVELAYTFKNPSLFPGNTSGLRIFINGTNLFSFDRVKDYDPERIGYYPAVRTFSLGLKVQF